MTWLSVLLTAALAVACAGEPEPELAKLSRISEAVCRGEPAADAADYPGAGAPHRIVMEGPTLNISLYEIPYEWQAFSVADSQLVSCTDATQEVHGECDYFSFEVNRVRWTLDVTLRSARTAQIVDRVTLVGDPPPGCPQAMHANERRPIGDPPDDALREWLKPFVLGNNVS